MRSRCGSARVRKRGHARRGLVGFYRGTRHGSGACDVSTRMGMGTGARCIESGWGWGWGGRDAVTQGREIGKRRFQAGGQGLFV